MTRSMPTLKIVAAVVALTAIIAAAAIVRSRDDSDDLSATPVPTGYATYEGTFEGHAFSFAYPEEWGQVEMKDGSDSQEAFFEISDGEAKGDTAASISLGVQLESASPEAILQANVASARAGGLEFEGGEPEDVDVVGATDAKRANATYTAGAGAEKEERQTMILVAGSPDETIFSLTISDSSENPELDLDAIAGSLEIGEVTNEPEATDV